MPTNVWYVKKDPYTYAYSYRWDETTPANQRTKTAKLFKDTMVEQIGPLMDGWMPIKPLAVTNGAYAPAANWWIDPVDLEQRPDVPADIPPDVPGDDPDYVELEELTAGDCVAFVKVLAFLFAR